LEKDRHVLQEELNSGMTTHLASFRDRAGFVFEQDGVLYRAITRHGRDDLNLLNSSGLYDTLTRKELLIPHTTVSLTNKPENAEILLQPERIPFVSYPYEWCFNALRDAALLTLNIQHEALSKGLSLKDASFFNVQFKGPRPIFIDTLSFEKREDKPWVAYRQFCQHFLAPLLIASTVDENFLRTLSVYLDGVPLTTATKLLRGKTRWRLSVLMHIIWHAKAITKHEDKRQTDAGKMQRLNNFGLTRQMALVDHLTNLITSLKPIQKNSEWLDYTTDNNNYSSQADEFKKRIVGDTIKKTLPRIVWDLGGNTGDYSRLATALGSYAVCFDIDPACVAHNYQHARTHNIHSMLPLVMDLANPSPAIGWQHHERLSLLDRGPADLALGLALVHHLRITANIPVKKIAEFFARTGKKAIVEFVPKTDSMVQRLLTFREDIFDDYTQNEFEAAFAEHFKSITKHAIPESERTLYYFET
jgi:ribosomal protein L11 methylase PrmA